MKRATIPSPTRRAESSRALLTAAVLFAALLSTSSLSAAAQQPATPSVPAKPPVQFTSKTSKVHRKPSSSHPAPAPAVSTPPPVAPGPPKLPDWPANDRSAAATVVWNSQGLRIEATNSSMQQILKDVATLTGTKIQGLGPDQRIFGVYGPGSARDVVSKLLEGSGYNVLMIGDQGQGTPRQIILSSQATAQTPPPAVANQNSRTDEDADAQDQAQPQPDPPAPPPARNGFAPGAPPRTPQQIMQEMQQRQQMIQQHANPQN